MADLPGFKKKRQGIAKTLRKYFAGLLKPSNLSPSSFSLVNDVKKQAPRVQLQESTPQKQFSNSYLGDYKDLMRVPTKNVPEVNSLAAEIEKSFNERLVPEKQYQPSGEKGPPPEKLKLSSNPATDKNFKVNIPQAKPVTMKVSAEGPRAPKNNQLDKGVNKSSLQANIKAEVKKQTKVDKDFELSLRYQMPSKLKNLDKKVLKDLSSWIFNQIQTIEQDRSEYMERLLKYRAMWLDFVSAGLTPVWEGAHQVHVPVIFEKIKGMHSRIYQAVLGIDPPFSLKPRDKISEVQKYEKEQLLSFVIKDFANYGRGWESVVDKDIWNFVADGTAITKQSWMRDVRKFSDVKEEFQGFKNGVPEFKDIEEETEKILFDGPILKLLNIEDFYIAGTNVDSPDQADLIGDRSFYSKSDLIKLAQQGFFFKEAIDEVINQEPLNETQRTGMDTTRYKQQQQMLSGVDKTSSGIKTYETFEVCCRYDIDKDGIDEELVVWLDRASLNVTRITYLERACPGAIRPYTIKRFIERPDSPYGIGMAEMMYGINNEIDYIHNQRLDYGTLQNLPFGFIRAQAGTKPKEIRLAPGVLYPTDDPQGDVFFPRLNGGTAYGFQEENVVTNYGDKLSGLSGFNAGSTQSQGPTRTATGTAALVQEVNANLDIHIKRYQRGYKRNLSILDMQLQELLPLGTIIRVLGMDGKELLTQFENRKAIQFMSDYELTANSVNSNKAVERDTASLLLQILQNPLALQGGLVTPQNLYNIYRNVLQKYEVRDVDAYITRPNDAPDSPYSAKDELTMILGGVLPPVYMRDRHEEKLAFFEQFENSEELSWFLPDQLDLYRRTKKQHEDYMSSIQSQVNQPSMGGGPVNPQLAAQLAAGGGVPQGQPAQQMSDLMPNQAAKSQLGGG